jgi:solute carrier family 50 protein (sugar transporter)
LAVANVISVSFYASPLTALRGVVKTRNAAALCAPMSAVAFANCCTWIYYGLAIHSPGVVAPSAVGALLSAVQLVLLLAFSSKGASAPLKIQPAP